MSNLRFFKEDEFTRCNPPCKLSDMNEEFMHKLDIARSLCEFPFIINSAYRSVDHEKSHGRTGTSSHCKGLAVDLACSSSVVRFFMLQSLLKVGFRRFGVYPTFLHVDDDVSKVSAIWLDKDSVCRG